MTELDPRLNAAWWALRIGLGAGPIIAGIDKYFNVLANWEMYLSPIGTRVLPLKDTTFMHAVGVVKIIAGIIVFSRWTKIGSYIVGAWLIAIAINLVSTGIFYDLAMRDMEIAIGVFALSQLSAAREHPPVVEGVTQPAKSRLTCDSLISREQCNLQRGNPCVKSASTLWRGCSYFQGSRPLPKRSRTSRSSTRTAPKKSPMRQTTTLASVRSSVKPAAMAS